MIFRFSPADFLWNHPLNILDSSGHVRYRLYADGYRLTRPVYIRDLRGQNAVTLLRQGQSLLPKYDMEVYGRPVGTLERFLRDTAQEYRITGLRWQVSGNLKNGNYDFLYNGTVVASCRKDSRFITVNCPEEIYALSALGAAVVLSCVLGPLEIQKDD